MGSKTPIAKTWSSSILCVTDFRISGFRLLEDQPASQREADWYISRPKDRGMGLGPGAVAEFSLGMGRG